ncbi:aldo/keto reductase [Phocaeicola paurosaccharolyticus]|uniref:aldo/keto reductase n=1 Tax=Phocaeicola paurosaccharolyticus TaxID=732242 RepID=UPI002FDFCE31
MEERKDISRRNFLKIFGSGIVTTGVMLYGCSSPKENSKDKSEENNTNLGDVPTDKMTYRINPTTKDKVSILGYGCMRWPAKENAKDDENPIDQEEVNKLVDYALAHGVNYFDTAPVYMRGYSEKSTGIALKRHPRDKYYIATKMSNFSDPSFENSVKLYKQSFKELQVDYIDYYLLHAIGGGSDCIQTLHDRFIDNGLINYLLKEREAGRIRNLGFSFHGDVKAFDYLLAMDVKWDFVQIQLNYLDWIKPLGANIDAKYLYSELRKKNIPAVIMEPLLGGRLATLNEHIVKSLKEKRPEDSNAAWAFRFAGSPEGVLTVLSGMTFMEHLQDNIRTYSPLEPVSDEEKELLNKTAIELLQYPLVSCTNCEYCMPCPYGLNIPGIFKHYNKCVNEGNVSESAKDENYAKARRAFLIGYDRSVPKLRQASHCIGCNKCVSLCPQKIDIPEELHRIDEYVEKIKQNKL